MPQNPKTVSAVMGRRELQSLLIQKAWKDAEFRSRIVLDPKGAFENYLGRSLPDEVRIFVHEEDSNTIHFSIPVMPTDLEALSEEQLERISGGKPGWAQMLSGVASGIALTMAANPW
jgi:nitrile hydratase alpha subunit